MAWIAVATIAAPVVNNLLGGKPDQSASQAAAAASQQMANISTDQWNFYKQNYQPLAQSITSQAQQASTPEAYAAAQGRAAADVTGAFNTANKSAESRMQAYGINPGSGAYQSGVGSSALSEGAAKAGALTGAYNTQRQYALNAGLAALNTGQGLPGQAVGAASGAAGAAGTAQQSLNSQFVQNQTNMANMGAAIPILGGAAQKYFGSSSTPTTAQVNNAMSGSTTGYTLNPVGVKDGGLLINDGVRRYADGGEVTEVGSQNDMIPSATPMPGLEPMLARKGVHPMMAKMAAQKMAAGKKVPMHFHSKGLPLKFASGGGVGTQGLEDAPSQRNQVLDGPGTETSDSIPAHVDGQRPAALSKGEFVMSAEVPRLTGEEILQAINRAGLEKRDSAHLNPNAGMNAYSNGGRMNSASYGMGG